MRKKSVPILICTIAICLGAFLLTNVPLDGLKDEVPKPVALAHHKFRGDALSTLTHSSLAQTYREPPITQDEAKAVELELLKKGFAKLRYSSGVLYSKNVGGIMDDPELSPIIVAAATEICRDPICWGWCPVRFALTTRTATLAWFTFLRMILSLDFSTHHFADGTSGRSISIP